MTNQMNTFKKIVEQDLGNAIQESREAADRELSNLSAEDKKILDHWAKEN